MCAPLSRAIASATATGICQVRGTCVWGVSAMPENPLPWGKFVWYSNPVLILCHGQAVISV